MTIHVVVDVDVLPGRHDAARDALSELAAATIPEPGCLQFDVFVPEEEADRLVLVETWSDQEAIDRHMTEQHTARFLEKVPGLLPHPPRARRIRRVAP